jgi:3-isopropylmalate dehydrogenase
MLLRHTASLEEEADNIETAITEVLNTGFRTVDIARGTGGQVVGTAEMGTLVADAVAGVADMRHAYHAV